MPTFDEALQHLGIDYVDDVVTRNVTRAMNTARGYLLGAVGADVFDLLPDDDRVTELLLTYTDDFYSERGTSAKAGNAKREMIHSMELQLKLELARIREKEGG